jgi:hypothetical protein
MLAALASAVAQQPAIGSEKRIDDSYRLPEKYAAQQLASYARCVASKRADRSRAMVLAPFGSPEQAQTMNRVILSNDDPCFETRFASVEMTIRPDALAGAVAQALVLREYPNLPTVIDATGVDPAAERQRAAQLTGAERFGRCVVWSNPAGVQALVQSKPASTGERAAVDALREDMGYCLAEGSQLKLTPSFLRNVTAVAAYRLAQQLRPLARTGERG